MKYFTSQKYNQIQYKTIILFSRYYNTKNFSSMSVIVTPNIAIVILPSFMHKVKFLQTPLCPSLWKETGVCVSVCLSLPVCVCVYMHTLLAIVLCTQLLFGEVANGQYYASIYWAVMQDVKKFLCNNLCSDLAVVDFYYVMLCVFLLMPTVGLSDNNDQL